MGNWLEVTSPYFRPLGIGDDSAKLEQLKRHIGAAITFVEGYCHRELSSATHSDIGTSGEDGIVVLKNCPVTSVSRICCEWVAYLTLFHPTAEIANYTIDGTSLVMRKTVSGTASTSTLAIATYPTITALATAIGALGWTTSVTTDYANYPTADLVSQQVGTATDSASIYSWVDYEGSWEYQSNGIIDCLPRYSKYKIDYTGGYASVPEDLKQATASLVSSRFSGPAPLSVSLGSMSYTLADVNSLIDSDRAIFRKYKERLVGNV